MGRVRSKRTPHVCSGKGLAGNDTLLPEHTGLPDGPVRHFSSQSRGGRLDYDLADLPRTNASPTHRGVLATTAARAARSSADRGVLEPFGRFRRSATRHRRRIRAASLIHSAGATGRSTPARTPSGGVGDPNARCPMYSSSAKPELWFTRSRGISGSSIRSRRRRRKTGLRLRRSRRPRNSSRDRFLPCSRRHAPRARRRCSRPSRRPRTGARWAGSY